MPKESSKVEIDQVDLSNLTTEDKYDLNYILHHSKDATIFHTIEWNKILIEEFDLNNKTLIAKVDDIPVGLYSFYISKEFKFLRVCKSPIVVLQSVYGGPITINNNDFVIKELLKGSVNVGSGMLYTIKTPPGYNITPLVEMGYEIITGYTSILKLQKNENELWSGLEGRTRGTIRKAKKNGVNVIEADSSFIDEFYKIFKLTYTRANLYILPKSFFERIFKTFESKDMVKMLLTQINNNVIGGTTFLCYKDMTFAWVGGSNRDYKLQQDSLMYWHFIKWANENGFKYYDFLGLDIPSIAKFKRGFGGDTVPFYHAAKKTKIYKSMRMLRFATSPKRIIKKIKDVKHR